MFEYIDRESVLTKSFLEEYQSHFRIESYPSKTVLLAQGQVAEKIFWIESGCMRIWLNKDGQEVTFQFFLENSLVASIESFWQSTPSLFTLETIEPTTVWVTDKKDLKPLLDKTLQEEAYRNLFIDAIFQRTFDYMQRSLSFVQSTPEQRYLNLVEQRPELIKRIAQHYIASYIGISKVHLSRIKKKLLKS